LYDFYTPRIDECKLLILKIIEQAVRDYLSLEDSVAPIEKYYYQTAFYFLFEKEYQIDYGGVDKSLADLLDILDIDPAWFVYKVRILKRHRQLYGKRH
jgi:hypothetical protein